MKQFIRKNIYKCHKVIGLITIIPVIFWCLSGLMHPFMAHWFKPQITNEFVVSKPLKKERLKLSLKQILIKNRIKSFKNFRIVQFKGNSYYQIKTTQNDWLYFDTQSGNELEDGDQKYAVHLARFFLADSISAIKSISLQTDFSQQYKYINRLLPVWKVSFERADHMDVYVETPYARLGTFNPTSRKVFLWVFDNFHNWTFLEKITNNTLRIIIMTLFLGVICISSISGILIYGFMWRKFKKLSPQDQKGILRKYHRQIGISVAFISLTFAFSGAYHATRKLEPNKLPGMQYEPIIHSGEVPDSFFVPKINWDKTTNISLVKMNGRLFYQVFQMEEQRKPGKVIYVNAKSNREWKNGNSKYAVYLADIFNKSNKCRNQEKCCAMSYSQNSDEIEDARAIKTEVVASFEKREYGFAFKRLPVVRVPYNTKEKKNLYIETATSRLAASIENADRYEGYSFAIFHKFLFIDWAGKNIRDLLMMLSAFGLLTVSIFGFILFLKK
jgi:hypothetical protein